MKPAVSMVLAVIPKYHTDSKVRFLYFEGHSEKLVFGVNSKRDERYFLDD